MCKKGINIYFSVLIMHNKTILIPKINYFYYKLIKINKKYTKSNQINIFDTIKNAFEAYYIFLT